MCSWANYSALIHLSNSEQSIYVSGYPRLCVRSSTYTFLFCAFPGWLPCYRLSSTAPVCCLVSHCIRTLVFSALMQHLILTSIESISKPANTFVTLAKDHNIVSGPYNFCLAIMFEIYHQLSLETTGACQCALSINSSESELYIHPASIWTSTGTGEKKDQWILASADFCWTQGEIVSTTDFKICTLPLSVCVCTKNLIGSGNDDNFLHSQFF